MADTKISALTELSAIDVVAADWDVVVDTSTTTTMKTSSTGARVSIPVTVSGTTDTLAAGDFGVINRYTNSSAVTVTIPTDASYDAPDGYWCVLSCEGAGGLSLSVSGITNGNGGNTACSTGEIIVVVKTSSANTWLFFGGTA